MLHPDLNDNEYDLTIYVPTKGRPQNALRLQDQFYKTTRLMSRIVFIKSDNDPYHDRYKGLQESITVSPTKPGFVDPLNLGYRQDRREVYSFALGFMGDDHMPRTDGWDEMFVSNLLELKSGFVYGNDGFQGAAVPTQIAMTSDIPLTLGFMTLPQLSHLYADNWWLDFGKKLGKIKYIKDAIIEHMHPAVGKAPQDPGYDFSGSFALDCSDKSIYQTYLNSNIDGDAKTVIAMMRRSGKI
jgi:hypothetical protein